VQRKGEKQKWQRTGRSSERKTEQAIAGEAKQVETGKKRWRKSTDGQNSNKNEQRATNAKHHLQKHVENNSQVTAKYQNIKILSKYLNNI
jgi:hypothetical protein